MNERELFFKALAIPEASHREAFVAGIGERDEKLRGRLVRLLQSHFAPNSVLDSPCPRMDDDTPLDSPSPLSPSRAGEKQIGEVIADRYRLRDLIGTGGMGTVYRAEQSEPVRRTVAIKFVRAGMGSQSMRTRFEAERQALAEMDHPNIAKIFDGGTDPAGTPYFVMELVEGIAITRYCDERRLPLRRRLELFVVACRAVQHAHQKGYIHRDLKPSNILIAEIDGRPTPKIIDFGVAKVAGSKLASDVPRELGFIAGTLEYMSPEQADPLASEVDTRTDVYALGVILCELLTGSTPLRSRGAAEGTIVEAIRIVQQDEPSLPSSILRQSPDRLEIARNRSTSPNRLESVSSFEFDWVVAKALEKSPSNRYPTALDLAKDVERFLYYQAVQAVPAHRAYVLRKFLRRNRKAAIAAGLLLASLVAGSAGTTLGLIEARQARSEERQHRIAAEMEGNRARIERERAVDYRNRALKTLIAMTEEDVEKLIGSRRELGGSEREYLESVVSRWREFADAEGDDAEAQALRADGLYHVGSLLSKLGRTGESVERLERSCRIYRDLIEGQPGNAGLRRGLVEALSCLGNMRSALGDDERALRELRECHELCRAFSAEVPDDPEAQLELGRVSQSLGVVEADAGDRDRALRLMEESRDIHARLTDRFPASRAYRAALARSLQTLGVQYRLRGRLDESRREFERGKGLFRTLLREQPGTMEYEQDLAKTLDSLGLLNRDCQRVEEAVREYEAALELKRGLVERYPSVPHYATDLGGSCCNLANLIRDNDSAEKSLDYFARAIAALESARLRAPEEAQTRLFLRNSHWSRAIALDRLGRHGAADPDWKRAVELATEADRDLVTVGRLKSRAATGKAGEIEGEFESLCDRDAGAKPKGMGTLLYDMATVAALLADRPPPKHETHSARAVQLLSKAFENGFAYLVWHDTDPAFAAIRERPDYKVWRAKQKTD